MTEPTDAELDAVLCNQWPAFSMQATLVRMWVRAAMRSAIAKWGTPPAAAGEPVAWYEYNADLDAWLLAYSHNPKAKTRPLVFGDTTPQPTQAQAGAELAEADRRAGAAERELASCREDVARFTRLRDQMKEQWGVDRNVSFDAVWAEALKLKKQAGAVPLTDEQIQEAILPINPHGMGYFLRIARAIEAAHGIGIKKGDSHG